MKWVSRKSYTRWANPPATESVALFWESVLEVKILQALPATAVAFHETLRATGAKRFRSSAFPVAWALPANHALFGSLQAAERCVACTSGDALAATAVTPANAPR